MRARAGTGSIPKLLRKLGSAHSRIALRRSALPSAALQGPSIAFEGSSTQGRPSSRHTPIVSIRRHFIIGRIQTISPASSHVLIAFNDPTPEPRAKRKSTVSAWSSIVCPRKTATRLPKDLAWSTRARRRASRAEASGPPSAASVTLTHSARAPSEAMRSLTSRASISDPGRIP